MFYFLCELEYILLDNVWVLNPKISEKSCLRLLEVQFFGTSLKHFIIHMVYAPAYLTKILDIFLFLSIMLFKVFCHYLEQHQVLTHNQMQLVRD